jgi:hypothetical protein
LVTTFHPTDNTLKNIVQNNWGILGKSTTTAFLHKHKPMMSYKRPPNLKDSIVRADIRLKKEKQQPNLPNPDFLKQSGSKVLAETQLKQTTITNFFNPEEEPSTSTLRNSSTSENTNSIFMKRTCLNIKCKYCPYINKSGQILCHSTKYMHQTKYNVTCHSSNACV